MRARSAALSAEATNPVVISQGSGKLRLRLGCRDGGGSDMQDTAALECWARKGGG